MLDSEKSSPSMQALDLKPRQGTFMFRRVMVGVGLSLTISIILLMLLATIDGPKFISAVLFLAGSVLSFYAALVAYRKERYEIHEHRVLCHRGGLFGDETTELELRNVTHLKIRLPWLRHKFFGIGHVMVESAGTSKPIVMFALREPESIYEDLRERLKGNGFDLTQQNLMHEESPAFAGIALEILGSLVALAFGWMFIVGAAGGLISSIESPFWVMVFSLLSLSALLALLGWVVVHVVDLMRRTYRVYEDVVVYEEGFLTRENAFIPYENIADARTKRTLLDQIFGIYDVHVSCQGSSAEIKFRRLKGGVAMSAAIDRLVAAAGRKPKWKPKSQSSKSAQAKPKREEPEYVHAGPAVIGELKMDTMRVLVPQLLLLPLVPLWIAALISSVIRITCTTYGFREASLRHHYSCLTTNVREFAYEKVTGVVVKRNLWDRLFGTMSLKFWSIGSGEAMEFSFIKCDAFDLSALMRQLRIPPASPQPYQAKVSFNVMAWLRSCIKALPALVIATVAVVVAAYAFDPLVSLVLLIPLIIFIISFIHAQLYYDRQTLSFHDYHVEATQGIITKQHFHACYRNIKRRKAVLYPWGQEGSLEIFVAGEEQSAMAKSQKNNNSDEAKGFAKPCSFKTGFLADANEVGKLLDDILSGRVLPSPDAVSAEPLEVLMEAPRSVKSSLIRLIIFSVVLFPVILVLPFTIAWAVVSIKRWKYQIDVARIVVRHGVFFLTEEVSLMDRVDSQKKHQGPVHKMSNNGNVTIMTAGSSRPDLEIKDCVEFSEFYDLIRDNAQ